MARRRQHKIPFLKGFVPCANGKAKTKRFGFSADATIPKHKKFKALVPIAVRTCINKIKTSLRYSNSVWGQDPTPGPGEIDAGDTDDERLWGEECTTPIMLRMMESRIKGQERDRPYGPPQPILLRTYLADRDMEHVERLRTYLKIKKFPRSIVDSVVCRDFEDFIREVLTISRWRTLNGGDTRISTGLMALDPNGLQLTFWEAVKSFLGCKHLREIDLWININAASIIRCHKCGANGTKKLEAFQMPSEYVRDIGKFRENLYLTNPKDGGQSSFFQVYCSNTPQSSALSRSLAAAGFHHIDSLLGREYYGQINRGHLPSSRSLKE
jgi:hypothetical protein